MNRLALGALLLVLAACGGGGVAASVSPIATTTVDLPKSYRFAPAAISVKIGDTVTWTNNDNFTHSVRIAGSKPLVMKPGESVTHTFGAAGTFAYDCSFHPRDMRGTVVVGG